MTTVLFVFLFFAGAALTAAAGNEVATIVSAGTQSADTQSTTATDPGSATTTDATTTDAATTTEPATVPAADPAQTGTTVADTTTSTEPSQTDTTTTGDQPTTTDAPAGGQPSGPSGDQPGGGATAPSDSATTPAPTVPAADSGAGTAPSGQASGATPAVVAQSDSAPQPLLAPQSSAQSPAKRGHKHVAKPAYASLLTAPKPSQVEHEANPGVSSGSVRWINEPLPDPTPPSLRLSAQFARELTETSAANGLDWAFLLAVLRAERLDSTGQVELPALQQEAAVLAPLHVNNGDRQTLVAYKDDPLFVERVLVLEHYYRALGLPALVNGLVASRDQLAARLLADQRIDIYPGGRDDISSGRLDVRVLAMMAFLSESFGDVRVSCLITGHRLYARPGVISAHIYGRAVDIAALDRTQIYGHQQPGEVTEQAIRQILLLPAEVMPKQVISLLGLGGPSFPLADHADHIHIGY